MLRQLFKHLINYNFLIFLFSGPAIWPLMFPDANGSHQSPVNVETCNVTSDDTLKNAPLTWKYEPDCCLSVTNTGHGWRVDVNGSDSGASN